MENPASAAQRGLAIGSISKNQHPLIANGHLCDLCESAAYERLELGQFAEAFMSVVELIST